MDREDRGLIIILEEDSEDELLTKSELSDSPLVDSLFFVASLDELFKYLHHLLRYGRLIVGAGAPRPYLILLNSLIPYHGLMKAIDEIHAILGNVFPIAVTATSQNEKEYIEEFIHPDVIGYLTKPITVAQLDSLIGILQ